MHTKRDTKPQKAIEAVKTAIKAHPVKAVTVVTAIISSVLHVFGIPVPSEAIQLGLCFFAGC